MSAREDLIAVAIKLGVPRAWLTVWLDSYRAEVLREAAEKIRDHGGTRSDEYFTEAAQVFADLIEPDKAES